MALPVGQTPHVQGLHHDPLPPVPPSSQGQLVAWQQRWVPAGTLCLRLKGIFKSI